MRLQILSDLHLEFGDIQLPSVDCDVLVLAGDIGVGTEGVEWVKQSPRPKHTIYLAGNHEFYRQEHYSTIGAIRDACADAGILFGHRQQFIFDGVRFLCATLWTDFALYGQQDFAMIVAQNRMNDFRLISVSAAYSPRPLRPADVLEFHEADREFLEERLRESFIGPTVVLTHFLPSRRSVAERYGISPLNAYYASALDGLIERSQPALWIHGHTHDSFDYQIGRTRVICNPRGYTPDDLNPNFNGSLVLEI